MKTALVSVCLVFAGLSSHAQQLPVKEANVVVVATQDSATSALKKFASVLVERGYTIDKLDREFLTVTTTPKTLQSLVTPISLVVRATSANQYPATISVRGEYSFSTMGNQTTGRAQFSSAKRGGNRVAFDEIQKAALAYPGATISYKKE